MGHRTSDAIHGQDVLRKVVEVTAVASSSDNHRIEISGHVVNAVNARVACDFLLDFDKAALLDAKADDDVEAPSYLVGIEYHAIFLDDSSFLEFFDTVTHSSQ